MLDWALHLRVTCALSSVNIICLKAMRGHTTFAHEILWHAHRGGSLLRCFSSQDL